MAAVSYVLALRSSHNNVILARFVLAIDVVGTGAGYVSQEPRWLDDDQQASKLVFYPDSESTGPYPRGPYLDRLGVVQVCETDGRRWARRGGVGRGGGGGGGGGGGAGVRRRCNFQLQLSVFRACTRFSWIFGGPGGPGSPGTSFPALVAHRRA